MNSSIKISYILQFIFKNQPGSKIQQFFKDEAMTHKMDFNAISLMY